MRPSLRGVSAHRSWPIFFMAALAFLGGALLVQVAGGARPTGPFTARLSDDPTSCLLSPIGAPESVSSGAAPESFLAFDGAVVGFSYPSSRATPTRSGLWEYKVKKGDTLTSLATQFGITVETVRAANPGLTAPLRPGAKLLILPVSGLLYEVREGDTLESITAHYQVSVALLKRWNPDYRKILTAGRGTLALPYARL